MEVTIGSSSTLALFGAMAVLAAVPSVSVLAVSARAATSGFDHGALTAAGIVLGDLIFILLAVFGLALAAEAMGPAFVWVKYAAGIYLLWLAAALWRRRKQSAEFDGDAISSRLSSFMTGLLITLGDQKAVLFYLGFLPAFVDLATVTPADVGIIAGVTVVAVGGVKLGYACAAARAERVLGSSIAEPMNILASVLVFSAGLWLILRT
ncbi:MAG: LysE family translocator [Gammaproteobacteria bacterium]|nr:MAG: LysE family translocator [Gammaproteobacteria bacterium]